MPSVGDIVHYILDSGNGYGECRPAIVVKVIEPEPVVEEEAAPPAEPAAQVEPVYHAGAAADLEAVPDHAGEAPPVEEVTEPEPEAAPVEQDTLIHLVVFTAGLEDFDTGVPGSMGVLHRIGIREDTSAKMPNYWHGVH